MANPNDPKKPAAVNVQPATSVAKPVRRPFPGPPGATAALRVAIDRAAHGEIVAHAQGSLAKEVCGVLVGQVGKDDQGSFVHVEAIIPGNAATEASTHVTFTQETWAEIHETLERDHPKQRIVGWYHTHPGFGVEFSEMDVFIQRNFFSAPTQIALVMDPTTGVVAIAINAEDGIEYLPRYWVDGREHAAKAPTGPAVTEDPATPKPAGDLAQAVKSLEARISQLVQVQDDQRAFIQQVMLGVGMVFCAAILGLAIYFVISSNRARLEPPRPFSFVPLPVKVGDKTVLVGVAVVSWEVPPELNALMLDMEKQKRDEDARAAAAAANAAARKEKDKDNSPPPSAPLKTAPSDERK